jgi:gamma-glutamylcyclotransferase
MKIVSVVFVLCKNYVTFLWQDKKRRKKVLYFAYGSNLWRKQMLARCPDNSEVGTGCLRGWRWIITTRGYASIVVSEGDYVLGKVYELSAADIHSLDRFEGVAQNHYRKEMIAVDVGGNSLSCLVYVDLVVEEGEPKEEYIARIDQGILDADFPEEYVTLYMRPYLMPLKIVNTFPATKPY